MSFDSRLSPSSPETSGAGSFPSETSGTYSTLANIYNTSNFSSLSAETTQHVAESDHANLSLNSSNSRSSTTFNELQSTEISVLVDEESGANAPESPRLKVAGSLKNEQIEEDDNVQFIKKVETDDCVITKTWSEDNEVLVIGNAWNSDEAIDVDAIKTFKREPRSQSVLEIGDRHKETEQDRIEQNHEQDRIALARQRIQIQSLVNNASTSNRDAEPESGGNDLLRPDAMVDANDEVSAMGVSGPSAPNPQSDAESSGGIFCSDYDEETKASLKRNRKIAANDELSSVSNTQDNSIPASPQPKRRRHRREMKVSNNEMKESMKVGLEPVLAKIQKGDSRKTRKPKSTRKSTEGRNLESSGVGKKKKKNASKRDGSIAKSKVALNSFIQNLRQSDIISDAQSNKSMPAIPTFYCKDKRKAVNEVFESSGKTAAAKADKTKVIKATEKFGRRLKSDGIGGWKLKGMKTSLYQHQIIGLDFMRDREKSDVAPFGGFMCDEMGFGKTIQTLANMIEGAPEPEDPIKTTLIVVPRHLVPHWANQINIHCEADALGSVLRYHAGSRIETDNPARDLGQFGIIITTYEEVRRSYPEFCPPESLNDDDNALRDWWEAKYKCEVGPLHTIKFRRIILDEAHMIKNFHSRTSRAVRALTATYRWALSGTPIQNDAYEYFPFFDFLKIPEKGPRGYGRFVKDYKSSDERRLEELAQFVYPMMIRRTHLSKLFGHPILKLPNIEGRPITVKLNKTERFIQRLLGKSFVNLINSYKDPSDVPWQYRSILTMYLRLRMFTGHSLVIQAQLKELLTPHSMKEMRYAVEEEPQPDSTDLKMLEIFERLTTGSNALTSDSSEFRSQHQILNGNGNDKLIDEFRRFLNSLKVNNNLSELLRRSLCPICEQPPTGAYITECMHIYCGRCLPAECVECHLEISSTKYCNSIESLNVKEQLFSDGPQLSTSDWIQLAGSEMHGAKLAATRDCINDWFSKSSDTKVLIFTQFIDLGRILESMCRAGKWGYATLNGKMPIPSREITLKMFREDPETRILICSLRTGGTGLDLTAANKCILLDLWWNNAVEQQAFSRVFRIGQEKDVEIVKIVAEGSADEWLTDMQVRKEANISKALGHNVLEEETILEKIAKPFGTVERRDDGLFHINPHDDEDRHEPEIASI